MYKALIFVCTMCITQSFLFGPNRSDQILRDVRKIDGVTLVAPPSPFPSDPMTEITDIGAGWISCVPYGFVRWGSGNLRYNTGRQWWGEKEEGIIQTIKYAHNSGVKVMLKPQIWSPDGWIGDYVCDDAECWQEWEEKYTEFILFYAGLANDHEVDMLCVGTELKAHMAQRPEFFKRLIPKIKEVYCGKLTYSANWDNFEQVVMWDQLDYVGLSAYFPLNDKVTPSVSYMVRQWRDVERKLSTYSKKVGKPILFTEYGYLSVDGSGGKTWLLEKEVRRLPINEEAQANCFEALYEVFGEKDYWAGGFIWKWFPHGKGGEGYNARDYTPQGKKAISVIKKYYSNW